MVFRGIEDGNEDADHTFGIGTVGWRGWWRGWRGDEEGTGEVADAGYDHCEVVATVPEAIVRGLIAENLVSCELEGMRVGISKAEKRTSMRPTTIERLGICKQS